MRVLFWYLRIMFIGGILFAVFGVNSSYSNYLSELTVTHSAMQASQLSGEHILDSIGSLAILFAAGVFYIAFELMVISYYTRRNTTSNTSVPATPKRSL